MFGVGAFLQNQLNLSLTLISFLLALLILLILRDPSLNFRKRSMLIFVHLSLISFPLVLLADSLTCLSAGLDCPVTLARFGLVLFPISIIISILLGTLLLPNFFMFGTLKNRKLTEYVRAEARRLGIRFDSVRVFDDQKPVAYSVGGIFPAIFVSVGMLDVLSRKEMEAVLLHELNHLALNAPTLKTFSSILKSFSPFARAIPVSFVSPAEESADGYAIRRQRTNTYLERAKRKVEKLN